MKRVFFIGFAVVIVSLFCNLSITNDKGIVVQSKDVVLPDWQWMSGNLGMKEPSNRPCFSIVFSSSVYQPGDSVKIIFSKFKVSLTNLVKGSTFDKWQGKVKLVYYMNKKWVTLVKDTTNKVNFLFSGNKNNTKDSLVDCALLLTVPSSRTFTIGASTRSVMVNGADRHGNSAFATHEGGMLSLSIKGIEVKKIN